MATHRTEGDKPAASRSGAPAQPARESSSPFWGTTDADESREARIRRAAYRKAEQRDFAAGGELDDWLSAEREIDEERDGN